MAAFSTVLGVLAAGTSAIGSIQQGKAERQQAEFQARVARQQAASEKQISADQERDYRKSQSARLAEIRASMGASGTDTSTGTPLLSLADFEGETERNALRIRSGGEIRSRRLEEQAGFYGAAGRSAQRTGYARAGSSLLTGFAKAFQ